MGQGFPICLPENGAADLINHAPVHTDVVVGGPGGSITGITSDGDRIALLDNDTWALPTYSHRDGLGWWCLSDHE